MKNNLISIIIPTYNEETRLNRLFKSLTKQSQKNFELVIIDDPKTDDNTKSLINKFRTMRIIYRQHPPKLTRPQKRNLGAKLAKSSYLIFADADMEFPANFIEKMNNEVNKKHELAFIPERTPGKGLLNNAKDFEKRIIKNNINLSSARFVSKKLFNKTKGFDPKVEIGEDSTLSRKAMISNNGNYTIAKTHINHYETSNGSLLQHLIKKYKNGKTLGSYYKSDTSYVIKRGTIFRCGYFDPEIIVKSPISWCKFMLVKLLEVSAISLGMIRNNH